RGQNSQSLVDVPGTTTNANQMSVGVGTLSIAKTATYPNQNTNVPQTNYRLGSFQVTTGSAEAVNLTAIEIDFTGANTFDASDDLSNLYVKYGNSTTPIKATVSDSDNIW